MSGDEGSQKNSLRKAAYQRFTAGDIFGDRFQMLLPDGKRNYRSLPGAILTYLLFVLLLAYSAQKYLVMVDRKDTIIM